ENYTLALSRARFDIYFANSIFMALVSVGAQLITGSMAAYAFAKVKFRLIKPLFLIFLCSMMIPMEATIISNYLTISAVGLMDTFFSVVCTSLVSVFGVFLLRQFYMTIPDALLEAAKIDGAGEIQVFVRIILPLGKSAMATIAIMGFISSWNSYLWPLIITNSMELRTVQTGLRALMTLDQGVEWNELMAMSTLVTIPVIALFVFLQKYFVQGVTKVGIK
ncbi:MAG: carbohydrate ABC transporter permease, partial [Clostridia bacterium]